MPAVDLATTLSAFDLFHEQRSRVCGKPHLDVSADWNSDQDGIVFTLTCPFCEAHLCGTIAVTDFRHVDALLAQPGN